MITQHLLIEDLKDYYKGQEGYCVSCGPSAGKLSTQQHCDLSKNRVVFAVKQAINLVPNANYHLYNMCNLEPWEYRGHRPTTISNYVEKTKAIPADIMLPLRHTEWLSRTQQWDEWTFNKGLTRGWGPGIMYDVAIYLFLHLGLKTVYISGWDCNVSHTANGEPLLKHFYNKETVDYDCQHVVLGSKGMYEWLKSKGLEIILVSRESALYSGIPRYWPKAGTKIFL